MNTQTKALLWAMFWWALCAGTIEWSFDNKNFGWMTLFAVLGGTSTAIALLVKEN